MEKITIGLMTSGETKKAGEKKRTSGESTQLIH
jgi:hypothetical protein